MKHQIEAGGKTHHVTLPDALADGQAFDLVLNGKAHTGVWLRRVAVLVVRDARGLERLFRVRSAVVGAGENGESTLDAEIKGLPAQGVVKLKASVRPDVPGQGNRARAAGDGSQVVRSPMTGKALKVLVKVGDSVEAGAPLVIVEAMKMENRLFAAGPGVVQKVLVKEGDAVQTGKELVRLSPVAGAHAKSRS